MEMYQMTGLTPPGPLAYSGQVSLGYITKTFAPTTSDINFNIGTVWIDTAAQQSYILLSKESAVANWVRFAGGLGDLETLEADNAVTVSPDSDGNIDILGTSTQGITTAGSINTITITASSATTSQIGVTSLATNAETIAGTVTTKAITPDDLKAKLGIQTSHGLIIGAGTTAALTATASGLAGQNPVNGGASANPAYVTPVASTGLTGTFNATTHQYALSIPVAVDSGGTGSIQLTPYA